MGNITLDAKLFKRRIWKLADKAEENAKKSLTKEFREDVEACKFVEPIPYMISSPQAIQTPTFGLFWPKTNNLAITVLHEFGVTGEDDDELEAPEDGVTHTNEDPTVEPQTPAAPIPPTPPKKTHTSPKPQPSAPPSPVKASTKSVSTKKTASKASSPQKPGTAPEPPGRPSKPVNDRPGPSEHSSRATTPQSRRRTVPTKPTRGDRASSAAATATPSTQKRQSQTQDAHISNGGGGVKRKSHVDKQDKVSGSRRNNDDEDEDEELEERDGDSTNNGKAQSSKSAASKHSLPRPKVLPTGKLEKYSNVTREGLNAELGVSKIQMGRFKNSLRGELEERYGMELNRCFSTFIRDDQEGMIRVAQNMWKAKYPDGKRMYRRHAIPLLGFLLRDRKRNSLPKDPDGPKRPRGRPRKHPVGSKTSAKSNETVETDEDEEGDEEEEEDDIGRAGGEHDGSVDIPLDEDKDYEVEYLPDGGSPGTLTIHSWALAGYLKWLQWARMFIPGWSDGQRDGLCLLCLIGNPGKWFRLMKESHFRRFKESIGKLEVVKIRVVNPALAILPNDPLDATADKVEQCTDTSVRSTLVEDQNAEDDSMFDPPPPAPHTPQPPPNQDGNGTPPRPWSPVASPPMPPPVRSPSPAVGHLPPAHPQPPQQVSTPGWSPVTLQYMESLPPCPQLLPANEMRAHPSSSTIRGSTPHFDLPPGPISSSVFPGQQKDATSSARGSTAATSLPIIHERIGQPGDAEPPARTSRQNTGAVPRKLISSDDMDEAEWLAQLNKTREAREVIERQLTDFTLRHGRQATRRDMDNSRSSSTLMPSSSVGNTIALNDPLLSGGNQAFSVLNAGHGHRAGEVQKPRMAPAQSQVGLPAAFGPSALISAPPPAQPTAPAKSTPLVTSTASNQPPASASSQGISVPRPAPGQALPVQRPQPAPPVQRPAPQPAPPTPSKPGVQLSSLSTPLASAQSRPPAAAVEPFTYKRPPPPPGLFTPVALTQTRLPPATAKPTASNPPPPPPPVKPAASNPPPPPPPIKPIASKHAPPRAKDKPAASNQPPPPPAATHAPAKPATSKPGVSNNAPTVTKSVTHVERQQDRWASASSATGGNSSRLESSDGLMEPSAVSLTLEMRQPTLVDERARMGGHGLEPIPIKSTTGRVFDRERPLPLSPYPSEFLPINLGQNSHTIPFQRKQLLESSYNYGHVKLAPA
ncbi:hypothetical protein BJ508DRAFT_333899, partial [Ascobolus immersus RN42]